ncbi:MAG TPA: histidine kinase dimerization/phospho-acceptor domain-containing protein [Symbiobacteriaceae bacterium]|nr:histidine kinase dimerization/phospho-acceptor domain-containing protein [Symbiobacteriaceae bacterium]
MQDPIRSREPKGDSVRLTRALAHDLRASVHGLRMALEMMAGAPDGAGRYLGMARAEAAQLDRLVEQLGLWIRLLVGDVKVRPQRVDLGALAAGRFECLAPLPPAPVQVLADKALLVPALDGLSDLLKAYSLPCEQGGVRIHASGALELHGPAALLPVLRSVVESPVPDLAVAKGPAMWLVGPALAVAACRAFGGKARLEEREGRCALWLEFEQA